MYGSTVDHAPPPPTRPPEEGQPLSRRATQALPAFQPFPHPQAIPADHLDHEQPHQSGPEVQSSGMNISSNYPSRSITPAVAGTVEFKNLFPDSPPPLLPSYLSPGLAPDSPLLSPPIRNLCDRAPGAQILRRSSAGEYPFPAVSRSGSEAVRHGSFDDQAQAPTLQNREIIQAENPSDQEVDAVTSMFHQLDAQGDARDEPEGRGIRGAGHPISRPRFIQRRSNSADPIRPVPGLDKGRPRHPALLGTDPPDEDLARRRSFDHLKPKTDV